MSLVRLNLTKQELIEYSLSRKEGVLSSSGVLVVDTGKRTGRSPKDRFIVKDENSVNKVDWSQNSQPIDKQVFNKLWQRATAAVESKEHFVNYLSVGGNNEFNIKIKVIAEMAWHAVFALNMFVDKNLQPEDCSDCWELLDVPSLLLDGDKDGVNSDGVVVIDFYQKKVLICGIKYSGEIKKSMFTVLNYFLPEADVLPMHCAANVDENNNSALFFGLSGTGKTTLSADSSRKLVGDDEHGWSKTSIFNFEGGCYAKCINLSKEKEPVIWDAIKPGAILENIVLDANGVPDYQDCSKTENTRTVYPLSHIPYREASGQTCPPNAVVFLACDLYGVLPPVSMLSIDQAAYYFLSGYTALVGSTEGDACEIKTTFSTCFGAAFFPRNPVEYANLLMKRLKETGAQVYLVNTGWYGGGYFSGGNRYSIDFTRSIVSAVVNNSFKLADCTKLSGFNLHYPTKIAGINSDLLDPRNSWKDIVAYESSKNILMQSFIENFKKFNAARSVVEAGPSLQENLV